MGASSECSTKPKCSSQSSLQPSAREGSNGAHPLSLHSGTPGTCKSLLTCVGLQGDPVQGRSLESGVNVQGRRLRVHRSRSLTSSLLTFSVPSWPCLSTRQKSLGPEGGPSWQLFGFPVEDSYGTSSAPLGSRATLGVTMMGVRDTVVPASSWYLGRCSPGNVKATSQSFGICD